MPEIGVGGGGAVVRAARPAPPPRVIVQAPSLPPILNTAAVHATAPAAQRGGFAAGIGAGLARTGAVAGATVSRGPHIGIPSGSDAASSGPGYGSAQANAFKQTPAYKQAIVSVFKAQPPDRQQAILQGAIRNPNALESKIVLGLTHRGNEGGALGQIGGVEQAAIEKQFPVGATLPTLTGVAKIGAHALSDAYHLPGDTVKGLYQVGDQLVHGHFGNALHMVTDPYAQFFADPAKAFAAHPLDSALMFYGPKAIVGRAAGEAARAGVLGDKVAQAASTAREPLRLPDVGGFKGPAIEARSWSRDAITQAGQKAIARARGENANVAQPAPAVMPNVVQNTFRVGAGAKIRRIADEMTATRQMLGRSARGYQMKVIHAAAPHPDVRNVVSHILQGVIRTPETAVDDIHQEIARLTPHAGKDVRSVSVAQARAQVRDLQKAAASEHLPEAFNAAAQIRQHLHASDALLTRLGLLNGTQALRSRLMPYAMAHMGAQWDPGIGLHVGKAPLDTGAILDHLKANGVPDPAYVGHYPGKVAPYRFYSAYKMARGQLGQKRTGEAFRVGAYDHTYDGLAAQGARTAEAVTKAGLHDRIVSRFGVTRPDGRDFTPVEARNAAHAAMFDREGKPLKNGGIPYVPMTRAPYTALDHVKHLQSPHELTDHVNDLEIAAVDRAIKDVESRSDSKRNVVLVPKAAVDQFRDQFAQQGKLVKGIGRVTQQFRRTVLPYSTHWMLQIGTEAGLRGLVSGVMDPRNLTAGRALAHTLGHDEKGQAALAEATNATFYNQHDNLSIHHDANPALALAKSLPPARVLIGAHNRWANFIGHAMSEFEHQFRLMGLGKLARQEVREFTGSWQAGVRLHGQNLAVLSKRMRTDPKLVAKMGRQIDDMFGKYNKFSPAQRAAIQSYAPFLPWYLSAARFLLWQLPVKSPVASSVLANVRQAYRQDVADGKAQPLDPFAAEQLARLSPFGLLRYPDKPKQSGAAIEAKDLSSIFLPQIEGSFENLSGNNSFGSGPLKSPNGDVKSGQGDTLKAAGENLLEAFLPAARYVREAREGTASSYGTSTVLQPQGKGAKMGAGILQRLFDPFYSFEQAKKNAGGGGATTGKTAIPGVGGGLGGVVIPGSGSTSGVVIP